MSNAIASLEKVGKVHRNTTPIAVVMCTYNGSKFLREQLDTILNQSQPPDQIFVRDDKSTDETPSILREYEQRLGGMFTVAINAKRLGFERNFRECILDAADYPIHVLSDQDDIWHPKKIEFCVQSFEAGVECVAHQVTLCDSDGNAIEGSLNSFIPQGDYKGTDLPVTRCPEGMRLVYQSDKVVRVLRAVSAKSLHSVFDCCSTMSHDELICLVLSSGGQELRVIEETLALHRQHAGNASGSAVASVFEIPRIGSANTSFSSMRRAFTSRQQVLQELENLYPKVSVSAERDMYRRHLSSVRLREALRTKAGGEKSKGKVLLRLVRVGGYSRKGFYNWKNFARDAMFCLIGR